MVRKRNRVSPEAMGQSGPRKQGSKAGLREVAGGFSVPISAGSARDAAGNLGKRRQFRMMIRIDESFGSPEARRALARARLADIVAMRDALVAVDRGAAAELLMRKAAAVAHDAEMFNFAIAAANVVMTRPSEKQSEASSKFSTWGLLARAWCKQELAALYPNAGYGKASGESTDEPRVEFLCKYIADVPLATFSDEDYWRAMRPARAHCKTDSTFKAYAQVARRVLKIAVELRIIPAWPLSAVCKLPIVAKSSAPVFPFLYPDEYVRLVRCHEIEIEWRVLWGFIVREGLRISEAFRIKWRHLSQLDNGRWLLDVPDSKTGRALNFVLNVGTGEVLEAFRRLRPDLDGPFAWMKPTNLKKAAERVRDHVAQSGTTRERLLFNDGRLRRLREHDLRSTFVTWCKLAGVDNETISQHTGHESSTMIARYNRSKATIEHLGLPRYLPLDQAMGLDVAGELVAGERAPLLLGSGETTEAEAPCPDCDRPMARVRSGEQSGWTCVHCNAAGDPEDDWREPVTSTLQAPTGPGNAPLTPEGGAWRPCCGSCGHAFPSGPGQYTATCPACGEQWDGSELPAGAPAPGSSPPMPQRGNAAPQRTPARPVEVHAAGWHEGAPEALAVTGRDGKSRRAPARDESSRRVTDEPLWSSRDTSRDTGFSAEVSPDPESEQSRMKYAVCARRDSNPHAHRAPEPKSEPGRPEGTNGGISAPEPAPEATGSDGVSRAAVTPLLAQLQAAHRQASEEFNWTAARGLEPLIEAERVRLAKLEFARREAEPVRLEVVRARKGGAS